MVAVNETSVMGKWGREVEFGEIQALEPPKKLGNRHYPINFDSQVEVIDRSIRTWDWRAINWKYYLDNEDQKMLCTWTMSHPNVEYRKNHTIAGFGVFSTNQKVATIVGTGDRCWLCSNGMYTADHIYRRKSTENALEDIRNNLWEMMGDLVTVSKKITDDWSRWDNHDLSSKTEVSDLLIEAADRNVINWRDIPHVRQHWLEPEHQEFKGRNLANFVQAFTSHQRTKSPFSMTSFSTNLHRFINDRVYGGDEVEVLNSGRDE